MNGEHLVELTIRNAAIYPEMGKDGLCRDLTLCYRRGRVHLLASFERHANEDIFVSHEAIAVLPFAIGARAKLLMDLGVQIEATLQDSCPSQEILLVSLWADPESVNEAISKMNAIDFVEYEMYQRRIDHQDFDLQLDLDPPLKFSGLGM